MSQRACIVSVVCALAAGMVLAEEAPLLLRPGESMLRSFPAPISAYDAPDWLSVRPMGPSVLRLTAGAGTGQGTLSLIFAGGGTEELRVEILDDAALYVRALRERLQGVAGVSVREKDGAVLGTVASRTEWEKLQAAIAETAEYFGRQPVNSVRLRVSDEPARVRQELEGLGYVVREQVTQNSPLNELAVEERKDCVVVSGKTYSDEALAKIRAALRNVGHLAVDAEPQPGEVACQVNVEVDKYLVITLNVAVLVLSDGEEERYGRQNALSVGSMIDFAWGRSSDGGSTRSRSRSATISSGDTGISASTTDFYAGEEYSRAMLTDSVRFTNHVEEPAKLHVGGTLMVNTGSNTDDTSDNSGLESVEFGLTAEVSGGLVAPNMVLCRMKVERSGEPTGEGAAAYMSTDGVSFETPSFPMILGRTYVLSHNRNAKVHWSEPSGTPILRHIPIVRWFFSEEENNSSSAHVLLLVSPIVEEAESITMPTSGHAEGVVDDVREKTGALK